MPKILNGLDLSGGFKIKVDNTDTCIINQQGYGFVVERTFILGASTPVTVGTNKTNQITITRDGYIAAAFINAKVAPTGADLIVDINVNGTTIWPTQNSRLKLVNGANTGSVVSMSTVVYLGDVLSIDIDQIGSTIAGSGITVQVVTLCKNQP